MFLGYRICDYDTYYQWEDGLYYDGKGSDPCTPASPITPPLTSTTCDPSIAPCAPATIVPPSSTGTCPSGYAKSVVDGACYKSGGSLIPGISNSVLMLSALGLVLVLSMMKR